MEFTKISPVNYNVKVAPGSTIKCEFRTQGCKKPIKLNVVLYIYFRHQTHTNMVDTISSEIYSVYTSKESKTHNIEIKVPEFKDCTQSFIAIQIDNSADVYEKVYLEYINVDTGGFLQSEKISENIQSLIQEPSPLRQSLADQLRASTIIPNLRQEKSQPSSTDQFYQIDLIRHRKTESIQIQDVQPRRVVSPPIAPMDQFYQVISSKSRQAENIQIQDVQRRRGDKPLSLNIISKLIGKGLEIIEGPKIIIASIVRNEQKNGNIERFLDCCQELEKYHKNIIYIFIEGDSSDDTYDILKEWIEIKNGSILQKIDMGYPPFPKSRDSIRTTYFAQLRNFLIELIFTIPDANEILMIDANYEWEGDIIGQLRDIDSDIAAPLVVSRKDSKGNYIFYDIWAFRKNDTEFWPFYPYAENMEFDKPIDAESVGGGYLIKRKVLEAGVKYDGDINSEQIGFCNNVRKFGFSIKINPKAFIIKLDPKKKSSI